MKPRYDAFGIVFVLILVIVLDGCTTDNVMPDDSLVTQDGINSVVQGNNEFAIDLYKFVKDDGNNLFFSPYSISTALTIAFEGARGKTADEMANVLNIPKDDTVRRSAFASIYNRLNNNNEDYKLHTANALWTHFDYPFTAGYISTIEDYYGGKATNLDFVKETEKSRDIINKWVEDKTEDKIKEILKRNDLNKEVRLVITNAIYFKGDWVFEFDKRKTRDADFYLSPDETIQVPMMALRDEKFNYMETEELQMIELPYKGDDLSMLVLLPKEGVDKLEESLTTEKLNGWRSLMHETKIDVYMPKFKFDTRYYLAEKLSKMGMPTAFGVTADFSGIAPSLFISRVIHQAYIDVDEEGTEAAAATAVVVERIAAMLSVFRADHPFIFLIQQKDTGNILFMGRVNDPRGEQE